MSTGSNVAFYSNSFISVVYVAINDNVALIYWRYLLRFLRRNGLVMTFMSRIIVTSRYDVLPLWIDYDGAFLICYCVKK